MRYNKNTQINYFRTQCDFLIYLAVLVDSHWQHRGCGATSLTSLAFVRLIPIATKCLIKISPVYQYIKILRHWMEISSKILTSLLVDFLARIFLLPVAGSR